MAKAPKLTKIEDFEAEDPNFSKVGDVVSSMLSEVAFQAERDNTWVLMDGRNLAVTNPLSDYEALVTAVLPDARGRFLRCKSHASGNNPDGDLALGQYQPDMFANHNHSTPVGSYSGSVLDPGGLEADFEAGSSTGYSGGNETRGKNITINYFIKINE